MSPRNDSINGQGSYQIGLRSGIIGGPVEIALLRDQSLTRDGSMQGFSDFLTDWDLLCFLLAPERRTL